MKKYIFCTFIFLTIGSLIYVRGQEVNTITKTIPLGDDTVQLLITTKPGNDLVFAHVHENEVAALDAGKETIMRYCGKLVTLRHSFDGTKNRNVTFRYANTVYRFDPNRIYTDNDNVLLKTIEVVKGKGKVDLKVMALVKNLANQIWLELHSFPMIVALHNNKNTPAKIKTKWLFWHELEPESYSIVSYIKRNDASSDSNKSCSDIYINPALNNSEFFIVTEKKDFNALVEKQFTVVLQNSTPVDDGSLSIYAQQKNIRYINAEAKMGNLQGQIHMLNGLLK
jgi:hypothetical protein